MKSWTILRFLSFCVVIVIFEQGQNVEGCPRIIPRKAWGSRPKPNDPSIPAVDHVFIHHSDTDGCSNQAACAQRCRSIQNHHIDKNHWSDIGYTFLIGGDGQIYEGTGWGVQGAHTLHHNRDGIGICFLGNFNNIAPSGNMLQAAKSLIQCGVNQRRIKTNYALHGHRDSFPTSCPGNALYNIIKGWPRYTKSVNG